MSGIAFDIENELSTSQAFTGAATVSTNSFQKQSAAQDIGIGRRMALLVYFHAAGAGTTHTLEAIEATNAALSAGVGVLGSVSVTSVAALAGNNFVELPIPANVMSKEYLGFRHSAAGGTTTATLSVWLVPQDEINQYKSFPKINNVSFA